uniref:Uncharacterized protein n=1 Tax=Vespula pensylvanica TaxID=30213 RepID=A0A834K402_VESPE|nr:hypothetical protein H0235_016393 [Vespula pensylvanica]
MIVARIKEIQTRSNRNEAAAERKGIKEEDPISIPRFLETETYILCELYMRFRGNRSASVRLNNLVAFSLRTDMFGFGPRLRAEVDSRGTVPRLYASAVSPAEIGTRGLMFRN